MTTNGRFRRAFSGLRMFFLGITVALSVVGCASGPDKAASVQSESQAGGNMISPEQRAVIAAGLAQAVEAHQARRPVRPYAAVYSDLGGVRPVRLNDKDRQASDSDTDLLLASIHALSGNPDLKAFAVFGLAADSEGQRWFVVHYETREGKAQLRQYPVPPPTEVEAWKPVTVEPSRPVIF